MAEIEIFRARNTTGLAINNIRVTKTKPYGLIQTMQRYVADDKAIIDAIGADVQPVKHGEWIDAYTWTMFHEFKSSGRGEHFWCSECEQGQKQKSNYCPNCGARMIKDGDAE